ncbi:MAG: exodeoxyribonuclease VII small subunit [Chloroflexi bacterium]|nr:exodeoxyribonuclease VII small subunit [Chloroflexota bacterium]
MTSENVETFESVYRELEETVRRLDAGGQTLDESIALYENGMRLAKRCQELLDAAELRIVTLQQLFATGGRQDIDDDE